MRQRFLSLTLLLLSLIFGERVFAYHYEANGIYYNINASNLTATVTYGDNPYVGVVIIPDSITYKGKTLPVKSVGESAFKGCTNLTSVQLGHCIEWITQSAFEGCSNLTSLTIPSNVVAISERAFYGCSNLTKLTVEDGDSKLFFQTKNTDNPSSLAFDCKLQYLYIGRPFSYDLDNSNLSTIIIGNKISSINGFKGSIITQITIPANVTWIGRGCFKDCKSLKNVYFEDCEFALTWQEAYDTTISGMVVSVSPFYDCPIENVYIGRQIKPTTGNIRFTGNEGPFDRTPVQTVSLSNSLTSLCGFNYCDNLKEIDIPASVVELSGFRQSGSLASITVNATNPPTVIKGVSPFENSIYLNATLYVPSGSIETYKADQVWGRFFDIQVMTDHQIPSNKCEKPSITYYKGKLMFTTNTEGAICHSTITNKDVSTYSGNEVQLGVSYIINVYATKPGYENSDVATATLCWIDVEPKTEGIENRVAQVKANPVLIQTNNGQITITGVDDGTKVTVYGVNGQQVGSAISHNGQANLTTNLKSGSIVIIKIGDRSVKATIK